MSSPRIEDATNVRQERLTELEESHSPDAEPKREAPITVSSDRSSSSDTGQDIPDHQLESSMSQQSDMNRQSAALVQDQSIQPGADDSTDAHMEDDSLLDDPSVPFTPYNQQPLLNEFEKEMKEIDAAETCLGSEFRKLQQFFHVWMQTSKLHEDDRLNTRMNTRALHLTLSGETLDEHQQNYKKIKGQFEALLEQFPKQ